jgi:hypothetical protein
MGLKSDITEAVTEALSNDLLDARSSLTFVSVSGGGYNPATGTVTASEASYSVYGVVETIGLATLDNEVVKIGDLKFLVLVSDLLVTPRVNDRIVYDSVSYDVNLVVVDPANVLWEIYARAA